MKVTIEKKTDQLNYEDFLGGVTRIVTIAGVKAGTKEQQYDIAIEGDQRVWRPAVTVLKLLVEAWGDDATTWVGRRAKLYGDPEIMFGRDKVGGIRVSHLSHISKPVVASLTETRGKRKVHTIQPLPDEAPTEPVVSPDTLAELTATFERKGIPEDKWLSGVNHYTKGRATALEVITEKQAQHMLTVLDSKPDAAATADPETGELPADELPIGDPA